MVANSIDAAMAEALANLDHVTNHLRKHGQHKAANEIGKLGIMVVTVFSEAVENIPATEFNLDHPVNISLQPLGVRHGPDLPRQSGNSPGVIGDRAIVHNSLQKQAVAALMSEVERENKGNTDDLRVPSQEGVIHNGQLPQTGSWAQVAGSLSGAAAPRRETAQYMSPMSMVSKQSHNNSDDEGDTQAQAFAALAPPSNVLPEIPEAKAGVIRVYGRISKDIIQFITTRIHEGPLQEIRLETNGRTRVTFQHASQALAFLKSNQEMEQMLGFGRFGCGYHVELAEIIDWNEDHRRMNQPVRERRRLSFARKRLFADNMSPEKWKQDIRAVAGPGNIDFLWVFNSGNATAVFTNTIVARKVLDMFSRWKMARTPYHGVSVTFSSDPCEKELVLVKETTRSHAAKNLMKRPLR
ncbi:uncharacterized protein BDW47DRAFT_120472 [Aspergillus candidus]|uniref:RRM domain-containing protein n=1 Tax=Aspergillus candidus TaxID=41067 RepID=A0A2I2F165_ASPCN|nr:hypothetical protein BDW47DRAFT_120472 [Aspergillus candidus]PLB34348.1 hypothetical protein BDW47DRAFT_120472 [Aspergillus candidus]